MAAALPDNDKFFLVDIAIFYSKNHPMQYFSESSNSGNIVKISDASKRGLSVAFRTRVSAIFLCCG